MLPSAFSLRRPKNHAIAGRCSHWCSPPSGHNPPLFLRRNKCLSLRTIPQDGVAIRTPDPLRGVSYFGISLLKSCGNWEKLPEFSLLLLQFDLKSAMLIEKLQDAGM